MIGIFLDTETNGLNAQTHKILEIAIILVDLITGQVQAEYQTVLALSQQAWDKSDPDSLKINGFTFEEIANGKKADCVAEEIMDLFARHNLQRKKAVFICQNPSFDRVFFSQLIDPGVQEKLQWPYHWLDLASMYWALEMKKGQAGKGPWPWETGVSKDLIASQHQLPKEEKPHRAMNGAKHLLLCYEALVGFGKRFNQ